MDISKIIVRYIMEQQISLQHISAETGISLSKLEKMGEEPFNATELCVLCNFLHVDPEKFYKKEQE